jgi:hypothetical protein
MPVSNSSSIRPQLLFRSHQLPKNLWVTNLSIKILLKPLSVTVLTIAALLATMPVTAQAPKKLQSRIVAPIDNSSRVTIVGSHTPLANLARDAGAVEASHKMQGISLDFSRTPGQEADLQALLAAQQDIHSPLYHQWLTPEQFGARFGVSDEDILATETWLQQQGFTIESVSRGRNHIIFSGTAGEVESAFGAPIHSFASADGKLHIAPANDLSVPASLASSVGLVRNLTSFIPHRHLKRAAVRRSSPHPEFTDGGNSFYLLTPKDLATMYDINAAYNAGYTGAGQSIAVVGISYILPSDIATFQSLSGVTTAKPPLFVLVPETGAPVRVSGEESESDLDVEYSSTIGKGAQVYFVYDGNSETADPFFAIQYAIDEKIAPIITNSYGLCEVDTTQASIQSFDLILEQGVAQGQTILSAAGDDGSVDCIESDGTTALAVDYPASSPYVTGMGATAFTPAIYDYPDTTYFNNSTGGVDTASTVKSYIPEVVWNDDDPVYGTGASGGGTSLYETPRPTWQAAGILIGGTALPTGKYRLVPDISLFGSPNDPGLLYCSSDPGNFYSGQTSSCTAGWTDSVSGDYTAGGGTSFDGPIFAGMLAIINQAMNSTGQGNVNPTLYGIAANVTNYPLAFHDITTGTNACNVGPGLCGTGPQTTSFAAGVGYDEASGLGSVDLMNLLTAWPKLASAALLSTTTTVVPASPNPALSTSDAITITVTSSTAVTGTASVSVDGTVVNAALPLTNGVGTYTFSSGFLGTHVIEATYSGDATHAGSSGIGQVSAGVTIPSFALSATNASVAAGSSTTSVSSATPANGYTGTVNLSITNVPSALINVCYALTPVTVISNSPGLGSIAFYTNANTCPDGATALVKKGTQSAQSKPLPRSPWKQAPLPVTLAGLLALVGFKRRTRLFRAGISLAILGVLSFGCVNLTGCVATPAPQVATPANLLTPTGVYTLTLNGVDSSNPTLTSSTTFTLTVH